MNLKNFLAGTVATAAVTTALVLGSAVGAQAQIFPTPTPLPPKSVAAPIYTQPSLPGFHAPAQLWTPTGPQVKHSSGLRAYTVLPSCSTLFEPVFFTELSDSGFVLTTNHSPLATQDPQLLALLASAISTNCEFANARTGAHFDVTLAIYANDAAANARLDALSYSAASGAGGRTKHFTTTGRTEIQDVALGQGGWDLVSYDSAFTNLDLPPAVSSVFQSVNIY